MESEMRDYVVSFVCDLDDYNSCHNIHFVTNYPLNSFGWWEDFYDTIFNLADDYVNFRILEITEGF